MSFEEDRSMREARGTKRVGIDTKSKGLIRSLASLRSQEWTLLAIVPRGRPMLHEEETDATRAASSSSHNRA
eukprot:CAMPEP_0198128010 /NCGR_PEP_ID=MMETSP1442-20131203/48422_1 /TAXON_ID= /ORGANISM="Craspedostauros australis, Strain CCMP3328" /LENGTH=71 /DNA_ID=CAMNT_0043788093 /DNA_START=266 /DNA_END=477 /DNA_ORIENTATION=+